MKDTDLMPWGVHKGKAIGEVPFKYLYNFYKKMWLSGEVLIWFENQLRVLEKNENDTAPLIGKKPKKYLIQNYECTYLGK